MSLLAEWKKFSFLAILSAVLGTTYSAEILNELLTTKNQDIKYNEFLKSLISLQIPTKADIVKLKK